MFLNIELNRTNLIAIISVLTLILLSLLMLLFTPKRSFQIVSEGNTLTVSNSNIKEQYLSFQQGMNITVEGRVLKFDTTSADLLKIGIVANISVIPEMEWQMAQYNAAQSATNISISNLAKSATHYVLIPGNQSQIKAIRSCSIKEQDQIRIRAQRLEFVRAKVFGKTSDRLSAGQANYLLVNSIRVNSTNDCVY